MHQASFHDPASSPPFLWWEKIEMGGGIASTHLHYDEAKETGV